MLLAILVIAAMLVYPMLDKPDKMGPKAFTRSKMRRIEGHILDFYSEKKTWPEPKSWDEQLRPYFAQSRSFSPEDLVLDAWGKKIKYELKAVDDHLQPHLYSCGPDGTDDRGTNDDIMIEVWRPKAAAP